MLKPDEQELLETAKWGRDLIKRYDAFLIHLGQPWESVYSETHQLGMQKADAVIAKWDRAGYQAREEGR